MYINFLSIHSHYIIIDIEAVFWNLIFTNNIIKHVDLSISGTIAIMYVQIVFILIYLKTGNKGVGTS